MSAYLSSMVYVCRDKHHLTASDVQAVEVDVAKKLGNKS